MQSAAAVSFAFLLGTAVLAAQSGTAGMEGLQNTATAPDGSAARTKATASQAQVQAQLAATMEQIAQQINGCPVTMRARHAPGGDAMKVNGTPIKGPAQRLHLMVANRDSRQIVAANVTVWGFTDRPRLAQTLTTHNGSDASRTLDVRFAGGQGKELSSDFAIPGLTATTSIGLNSITYADGSSWKLATGSVCRSSIDGLMYIGER